MSLCLPHVVIFQDELVYVFWLEDGLDDTRRVVTTDW
jgi:hypothetical protein